MRRQQKKPNQPALKVAAMEGFNLGIGEEQQCAPRCPTHSGSRAERKCPPRTRTSVASRQGRWVLLQRVLGDRSADGLRRAGKIPRAPLLFVSYPFIFFLSQRMLSLARPGHSFQGSRAISGTSSEKEALQRLCRPFAAVLSVSG